MAIFLYKKHDAFLWILDVVWVCLSNRAAVGMFIIIMNVSNQQRCVLNKSPAFGNGSRAYIV